MRRWLGTAKFWITVSLSVYALCGMQAQARATLHPTVSLSAQTVGFYAGHVVLDARGGAQLDDGMRKVHADRIILDLRANRYVAAGAVTVSATTISRGDAFGADLVSHGAVLVSAGSSSARQFYDGSAATSTQVAALPEEPLALPDIGFEQPYAVARRAVAHLGADVRLAGARIIVPGGESVPLPSYVFTFSSDPGYAISNLNTGSEDVPIYFGSTPNSIQGIHFSYNPKIKVAIGLDDHIVYGNRAYDLLSFAPLFGPDKIFNFTWQQYINEHASQTFNSQTLFGFGTFNNYDVRDSIHRSFLDFNARSQPGGNGATIAWQGFDQTIGPPQTGTLFFHVRSEYGFSHATQSFTFAPFASTDVLPNTVFHRALETYVATRPIQFGSRASVFASVDAIGESDVLPHRQLSQTYQVVFDRRWNNVVETTLADRESPLYDFYPSVNTGYHSRISAQTLQFSYDRGDPFALRLGVDRATSRSDAPFPPFVFPWVVNADVRFRVSRSLSLDLNRSYYFGYAGQRFGSIGFQVLP